MWTWNEFQSECALTFSYSPDLFFLHPHCQIFIASLQLPAPWPWTPSAPPHPHCRCCKNIQDRYRRTSTHRLKVIFTNTSRKCAYKELYICHFLSLSLIHTWANTHELHTDTHTHTHRFPHKSSPIYYWVDRHHFRAWRSLASITLLVATRQPH